MPRRIPPQFQPGPLSRAQVDALNQLSRDFYGLFGHFGASPPLEVSQGLDGVNYRMNPSAGAIPGDGASTALEILEVDGSPDLSITVLQVDQADGFVLTPVSAGVARLDMTTATSSQVGIVSLADQYLGAGIKTVDKLRVATVAAIPLASAVVYANGSFVAAAGFGFYVGDQTRANVQGSLLAGSNNVVIGAQLTAHDLFFELNASTHVGNLNSTTDNTLVVYSCRNIAGVSGTGGGGDTVTGGIVTALGAAGSTGTVTLAKVTVGGANGSLTFSNGRITGFVAPT